MKSAPLEQGSILFVVKYKCIIQIQLCGCSYVTTADNNSTDHEHQSNKLDSGHSIPIMIAGVHKEARARRDDGVSELCRAE